MNRIRPVGADLIAVIRVRRIEESAGQSAGGEPIGVIVRWDTPTGKDILPVSRRGDGWIIGGMATPRPLYRLPDLPAADHVFVAEGGKATDALRLIGLTATILTFGSPVETER